jgi:pyridoxamine 5'-phosphate oxidase
MAQLFPSPSADFDHPIDMLDGCHGRIRQNCERIEKIAAHVASVGVDAEARDAAHAVVRFFDTAGATHHRDEEEDLFPVLLVCAPRDERAAARVLIDELRADHLRMDHAWRDMRRSLLLLAAVGNDGLTAERAREFRALYERHIAREESQMLPGARDGQEPGRAHGGAPRRKTPGGLEPAALARRPVHW